MSEHLYLLGHPVGHSKSAVMYNAVYEAAGLPWRYELLDCATEEDARAVLDALGMTPFITAGMHLGEGTGAVALMPMLDMAYAVYFGMCTFEDIQIEDYQPLD